MVAFSELKSQIMVLGLANIYMGRPTGDAHISCGIDTIKKSWGEFSERDNKKADAARRLQHVSGHPSDSTLVYSLLTNGII